jgi:hypothetical protein
MMDVLLQADEESRSREGVSLAVDGAPREEVGRARLTGRAARVLLAVLATAAVFATFFAVRQMHTKRVEAAVDPSPRTAQMPTSNAIEDTYGVRFDRVVLTADGGMLQVGYTILDNGKAGGLHDDLPYLVTPSGDKLDQPGIAGHGGHDKNSPDAGKGGYLLIANSDGAAHPGSEVSIRVGRLRLDHVVVQG